MTESYPDFPGEAPAETQAAPVREFTPDELAAAAQQLAAQNVGVTGPEVGSPVDLGAQAVAAGAEATEVDAGGLLAQIRALTDRVNQMESDKRKAEAPAVVRYATALRDHLALKADAHPATQADPDHSWGKLPAQDGHGGAGVLGAVSQLVTHAEAAAESGHAGNLGKEVGAVESWVNRHAKRFPHIDYSYILDLAGEAAQAVALIAA
jgi:hypothetical protein